MILIIHRASIAFMWLILAICSALFAALTSILAKIGIDGVDSTLATAIRTVVVVLLSWGMVFITNTQNGIFWLKYSLILAFCNFKTLVSFIVSVLNL